MTVWAATVTLHKAQSWRDTRVAGDSPVPTARWSSPFFLLFSLCGVAWPPMVFLRMSRMMPLLEMGIWVGSAKAREMPWLVA